MNCLGGNIITPENSPQKWEESPYHQGDAPRGVMDAAGATAGGFGGGHRSSGANLEVGNGWWKGGFGWKGWKGWKGGRFRWGVFLNGGMWV